MTLTDPYDHWLATESNAYVKNSLVKSANYLHYKRKKSTLTLSLPFWTSRKDPIYCTNPDKQIVTENHVAMFITMDRFPIAMKLQNQRSHTLIIEPGVTIFKWKRKHHCSIMLSLHPFVVLFEEYREKLPGHIGCWKDKWYNRDDHVNTILLEKNPQKVNSLKLLARKACVNQKKITKFAHSLPFCAERTIKIVDGDLEKKKKIIKKCPLRVSLIQKYFGVWKKLFN